MSSRNNLPFSIEMVESVEIFKLKLKKHTSRSFELESNIGLILNIATHKDWSLQCHYFLVLKSGPTFLTGIERGI